MKNYTLLICLFCSVTVGFSQKYTNEKGQTHLWGKSSIQEFSSGDYNEWYLKNSRDYKTSISFEESKNLKNIDVEIFVGTWCGDTKYLVPKFIETWNQLGLDTNRLHITALHNEGKNYKQGPNNETIGKNIHKVPTFIFSKSNNEIGRIVERTVFDLDTDILLIANGEPYEERYQGVKLLNNYFEKFDGDTLLSIDNFKEASKLIRRELSTSSELNSMGYVLMAQNELDKAEFTFRLNKYLFPYTPNIIGSYGEFLFNQERYHEALNEYLEVIRLKGEDRNASRMISKIYAAIDQKKDEM